MSFEEVWQWLGPTLEYSMAIFAVLACIFFFFAVIKEKTARRYGILSGISAIMVFVCLVTISAGNTLQGTPASSLMGTFQLTLGVIFIITGVVLIYFALDAKKIVNHDEACYSTLLLVGIFFVIGVYLILNCVPVFFGNQTMSTWEDLVPSYSLMYPFPIGRVVTVIIPLTLYAIGVYTLKEMKSKTYETVIQQDEDKFQVTLSKLDLEISRKIFHVIIIVVLVGYLFVGRIVMDSIYKFTLLGLPQAPNMPPGQEVYDNIIAGNGPIVGLLDFRAGHLLLVMAVSWIVVILLFTDFVRIKKYRYYPFKMLAKVYRDKERLVLAPHIYLTIGIFFTVVLSSAIDLFLNMPTGISAQIVMISVMVSALADAVATIVGITKGNRHLKGGKSKKTWEGWIAGFIAALILGLLSFMALMPQYGGTISQAIIFALIAAGIFGLIDYLSPPISDNILNPVAITLALWTVTLLFFI